MRSVWLHSQPLQKLSSVQERSKAHKYRTYLLPYLLLFFIVSRLSSSKPSLAASLFSPLGIIFQKLAKALLPPGPILPILSHPSLILVRLFWFFRSQCPLVRFFQLFWSHDSWQYPNGSPRGHWHFWWNCRETNWQWNGSHEQNVPSNPPQDPLWSDGHYSQFEWSHHALCQLHKKMARSSISQRAPDPTVPPLPPPGPTPININPKPLIQTAKRTTHYTRRKLW